MFLFNISFAQFYLQDTKSSNGTFINNQRLSRGSEESPPKEINSGDIIQFGVDVMENSRRGVGELRFIIIYCYTYLQVLHVKKRIILYCVVLLTMIMCIFMYSLVYNRSSCSYFIVAVDIVVKPSSKLLLKNLQATNAIYIQHWQHLVGT